jgi:tellurite resistance protein TehA-like permease
MFTFVAACAVLGARWDDQPAVVWLLGGLALAAWLVLAPLAAVDVGSRSGTDLREHARGAWLLPSVATAGLAITAADLAVHVHASSLMVIGAVAWFLGIVLYLAVSWLIGWQALAAPLVPEKVTPDSWILMGALAITFVDTSASLRRDLAGRPGGWLVAVSRWVVGGGVPAGDVLHDFCGNGHRATHALVVDYLAGVLLDRLYSLDTVATRLLRSTLAYLTRKFIHASR